MGRPSLSPSSVAVLATAGAYEHRCPSSPDDDYYEDDDFEFTPLLLRPRRRRGARTERPRTAHAAATQHPSQQRARRGTPSIAAAAMTPASRKVRWHDMAFGSVRVPAAMDRGEIRRRLHARRHAVAAAAGAGNEPSSATAAAGWAPWRLIRSLSCKGVEAVAAAAAPVRLV